MNKILLFSLLITLLACQEEAELFPQISHGSFLGKWAQNGDTLQIGPGNTKKQLRIVEAPQGLCVGSVGEIEKVEFVVMGEDPQITYECLRGRRNGHNLLITHPNGKTYLWRKVR